MFRPYENTPFLDFNEGIVIYKRDLFLGE